MSSEVISPSHALPISVSKLADEVRAYISLPTNILLRTWNNVRFRQRDDYAMHAAEGIARHIGLNDVEANLYARQIQLSVLASLPQEDITALREILQEDVETILKEQREQWTRNIPGSIDRIAL